MAEVSYFPFVLGYTVDVNTGAILPNTLVEHSYTKDAGQTPRWAMNIPYDPLNPPILTDEWADVTTGKTLAVGLQSPKDYRDPAHGNIGAAFQVYLGGKTFITDQSDLPTGAIPSSALLRIGNVGASYAFPSLDVNGKSQFTGDAKVTGNFGATGSTTLGNVQNPGTQYTLNIDDKIVFKDVTTTLKATMGDLWDIVGASVGPVITIDHDGNVRIEKALTVGGDITTTGKVSAGMVSATTVSATTVNATTVNATTVNANDVYAKNVTADQVKAKTLDADTVNAKTVNADQVKAKNIDALNINTANLNALNVNAFNLNAVLVNAMMVNANTVNSNTVNSNTVNSNTVNSNTVNANTVNANTVNANTVNANTVNANTVNSNTVNAPFIKPPFIKPPFIKPPPPPPKEGGSPPKLKIVGGFIGQKMWGKFVGPGKYVVVGQAPPIGKHGGRYGVTIRNGVHFCSLRVIPAGDSILSWGNADRFRIRYEGTKWSLVKKKFVYTSRDIVNVDRRGRLLVFGGIATSSYGAFCDERYKEAITPLDGALGKILAMRGVSYFFRDELFEPPEEEVAASDAVDEEFVKGETEEVDFKDSMKPERRRRLGLIAQEVEKVCPELISTDQDGYKVLDVTQLNPLLLEAIKDQQRLIETQGYRIAHLERALLGASLHPSPYGQSAQDSTQGDNA